MRALALLCVLLGALGSPCLASSGDEAPEYRGCLYHCVEGSGGRGQVHSALCVPGDGDQGSAAPPIILRWTAWTCETDCGYLCMWAVEGPEVRAALQQPTPRHPTPWRPTPPPHAHAAQKYHGKWPFTRWLGLQEPLSSVASLLNAAAHARALRALWRAGRRGRPPYLAHCLLSLAAWLASAAFHARDTRVTERADYFLAGAVVALGVHVTALRTLRCVGAAAPRRRAALGAVLGVAYLARVHAMLTRRFDYGGWVVACLALGLLQTLLWLRWAWWTREGTTHPSRRSLLVFIASLNAASLLEVLDFPPLLWHTLDAHAVWHLATIPLWALWYRFVLLDLQAGQVMWSLPLDSAGEDKEL